MKKGQSITISTRKITRNKLRREAKNSKPSKYLASMFDSLQIKKYGIDERLRNQARGTHKRKTWKTRLAGAKKLN